MSFEWKKHAECPGHMSVDEESCPCDADRAEMIAEGERLQVCVDHYLNAATSQKARADRAEADNEKLETENARFREALESVAELNYCIGRWKCACWSCVARAALSGEHVGKTLEEYSAKALSDVVKP